jgi:hypothetical protein
MKKSLFPRLALMAVVVALVSACSEKKFEYTNVIPANASTVVSINMKSLVDKAGLNDKENKEAQQKLTDAMKSGMNAATFQQVEMIMKDPKKSGIDVSAPLYVFNTETFPTTVIAKVSNEDDLHALLETLEKEKVCQPLASGDGFQFTQMGNQVFMAYTPSVLMLTNYKGTTQLEKIKQDIPALLKQTNENSIVSTAVFKKMQKMGGDIDAMLSPASLIGPYANMIKESDMPFNMKDLKMLGSLSFEKGKISMKYENFTESPELQALFDKQKKATCPIENTFLKYFPKSTLISMFAWVFRFGLFGFGDPGSGLWMLILSMIVYGMAFDFFNISGSLFVEQETSSNIRASAQGLFFMMTNGLGAIIGGYASGAVVDAFSVYADGKLVSREWPEIWLIFAAYALVIGILFALVFKYKHRPEEAVNKK